LVKNLTVATGKRKTSIARVFLRDGAGNISINGKTVEEYFGEVRRAHHGSRRRGLLANRGLPAWHRASVERVRRYEPRGASLQRFPHA
jgi:hypothetical protein